MTFQNSSVQQAVKQVNGTVLWDGALVKALRTHMGFTQSQLAEEMGVRQQTVSEWEKGVYQPTRASSKHLSLVAEKAGFAYLPETDRPDRAD